jgi:hypothetical protein
VHNQRNFASFFSIPERSGDLRPTTSSANSGVALILSGLVINAIEAGLGLAGCVVKVIHG